MTNHFCPNCGQETTEDQIREFCALAPSDASPADILSVCVKPSRLKEYQALAAKTADPAGWPSDCEDPCMSCQHNRTVEVAGTRIGYADNGLSMEATEYEILTERHRCRGWGTEFEVDLKVPDVAC